MSKSSDITEIINMCIEAVETSKAGPLFINEDNKKVLSTVSWETYKIILNCVCPHTMEGAMEVSEPKEDWQKGDK